MSEYKTDIYMCFCACGGLYFRVRVSVSALCPFHKELHTPFTWDSNVYYLGEKNLISQYSLCFNNYIPSSLPCPLPAVNKLLFFGGGGGGAGGCQLLAVTPCCDSEGGSIAEITTVEQQVEINYQFLTEIMLIHRRHVQESWHINTNILVTWIVTVFFTANVPEMILKSHCLDFCVALSFEDFSCRYLKVLISKWVMTLLLTFETL